MGEYVHVPWWSLHERRDGQAGQAVCLACGSAGGLASFIGLAVCLAAWMASRLKSRLTDLAGRAGWHDSWLDPLAGLAGQAGVLGRVNHLLGRVNHLLGRVNHEA
jgi:hypothetical protein